MIKHEYVYLHNIIYKVTNILVHLYTVDPFFTLEKGLV